MFSKKYIAAFALLTGTIVSCQKTDSTPIDPGTGGNLTVYPVPTSKWMTGTSGQPYYSSGWVGDAMPFYDSGKYNIYYLHDARDGKPGFHPIHKFTTTDLANYTYEGLMVDYAGTEDQDLAIGTGSVVKVGSTYYCYYTGHNYTFPGLGRPKEGIMYATSTDQKHWTKKRGFNMLPPAGYETNDFRDPQVFFNTEKNEYWMLVTARTGNNSVVALFTSTNPALDNWQLKTPLYTRDDYRYYVLECPDVFKMGNYWYLFFSEGDVQKTTHYRMATSSSGPWTKPAVDVFDGTYWFAGKTAGNGTDRYAFGWTGTKGGYTDGGNRDFGGNLVVHKLVQATDGTLSVQAPASTTAAFWPEVALAASSTKGKLTQESNNFTLADSAQVLFGKMTGKKMITATISGLQAASDAGFLFGARDMNNAYKIGVNVAVQKAYGTYQSGSSSNENATIPLALDPAKEHTIKIIIDGTVAVAYFDEKIALSNRAYILPNATWGLYSTKAGVQFKNLKLYDLK